jgi:hypothetical protein
MNLSMRNLVASISGAFLVAAVNSPAVMAAPTFGDWTVTGGTITPGTGYCGTTATCVSLVTGDGFAQYEVTEGASVYVFTVITDAGANGDPTTLPYFDESYIQRGNVTGLMGRQHSYDAPSNFTGDTKIYTGWATVYAPSGANLDITQGFSSAGTAATGDEFASSFHLLETIDAGGAVQGKTMSIRQDAALGDGTADNLTDRQSFAIEYRSGTHLTTPGDLTLGYSSASPTPLTWVATDEVMVTWIGQNINVADPGATDLSIFGYEGIDNRTAATASSTFSTSNTDIVVDAGTATGYVEPFDWDTAFGTDLPTLKTTIP